MVSCQFVVSELTTSHKKLEQIMILCRLLSFLRKQESSLRAPASGCRITSGMTRAERLGYSLT